MSLPWTKFQDFYLRLGFLKVLVVTLDKGRTSTTNEHVFRRLRSPLFDPASSRCPDLWSRVRNKCGWYAKAHRTRDYSKPTVAEALLIDAECPSLLFAVTQPTVYKILDWGRDLGLVGRGNQITERGLLLRALIPESESREFVSGSPEHWNPFVLTKHERIFFFYHLCDMDRLSAEIVRALGAEEESSALELRKAGQILVRTFHGLLHEVERDVRPSELPTFRAARDLAATMAEEMEMTDLVPGSWHRRAVPRRRKPGSRGAKRRLTKNTDHQTVPRFEQLTDLGFLRKAVATADESEPRRRWIWYPTTFCKRWRAATERVSYDDEFLWTSFGAAAVSTFSGEPARQGAHSRQELASRTWAAYRLVGRPMGPSPLESIALCAMVEAAAERVPLEMSEVHDFMLRVKRDDLAPEHAHFAGGNGLDQMFVRLKEGFREAVG